MSNNNPPNPLNNQNNPLINQNNPLISPNLQNFNEQLITSQLINQNIQNIQNNSNIIPMAQNQIPIVNNSAPPSFDNMNLFTDSNPQINMNTSADTLGNNQEKNIYDYATTSTLYSISFQNTDKCRLAIGTLECSLNNRIEILELVNNELDKVYVENLEYPSTKLMWGPNQSKNNLLASSSDCIHLFELETSNGTSLKKLTTLYNKKSPYCGPLTSFDWNKVNDSILGTASLDTTCTIWDLNKSTIRTQLIAHDKEVYDISFTTNDNIFISSGADGSVRLFDLRSLKHSTIIYETKDGWPITKISWNLLNNHLIAALSLEKNLVFIFDTRKANVSLVELKLHKMPVTGMVWSPSLPSQICSVSEDKNVIISNVQNEENNTNNNVCYTAPNEINNVNWCESLPEWIGITFKKKVQLLRK